VAGGERQVIVERATWPQISPDGQTLAYVAFDYDLKLNDLFFASLDGTNATHPMALGSFLAVDAPVFSPDGRFIYFSATGAGPTSRELSDSRPLSWLERLMGIQIAHANGAPSDWWSLPTAGGDPVQLTMIAASGLSGTFSPDGLDFATVSTSGLGVMQADGADFTWLFDGAAVGAVLWLP
jgi:Tol biopolymer transport system component